MTPRNKKEEHLIYCLEYLSHARTHCVCAGRAVCRKQFDRVVDTIHSVYTGCKSTSFRSCGHAPLPFIFYYFLNNTLTCQRLSLECAPKLYIFISNVFLYFNCFFSVAFLRTFRNISHTLGQMTFTQEKTFITERARRGELIIYLVSILINFPF